MIILEIKIRFNTASVLIQQESIQTQYPDLGFNTASVLIQLDITITAIAESKFQYSFCSYSTYAVNVLNQMETCFNTASVLIQRNSMMTML